MRICRVCSSRPSPASSMPALLLMTVRSRPRIPDRLDQRRGDAAQAEAAGHDGHALVQQPGQRRGGVGVDLVGHSFPHRSCGGLSAIRPGPDANQRGRAAGWPSGLSRWHRRAAVSGAGRQARRGSRRRGRDWRGATGRRAAPPRRPAAGAISQRSRNNRSEAVARSRTIDSARSTASRQRPLVKERTNLCRLITHQKFPSPAGACRDGAGTGLSVSSATYLARLSAIAAGRTVMS